MSMQPLRPSQLAAESDGSIQRDLFRWLMELTREVNNGIVPPQGVVFADLSAGDITDNFDGTGLGNPNGAYANWAICNGSNGTSVIPDYSGLTALMRVN